MKAKSLKTTEENPAPDEGRLARFAKAKIVASRFGICSRTVHRWANSGLIHPHRVNSRVVLFDLREVEQFIQTCRSA